MDATIILWVLLPVAVLIVAAIIWRALITVRKKPGEGDG